MREKKIKLKTFCIGSDNLCIDCKSKRQAKQIIRDCYPCYRDEKIYRKKERAK